MSIAGTRLAGRYTLIRPLGRGASSVVYVAMGDDGKPYTVKLFHERLRENARREASMQLQDPHLGEIIEVSELGGHPAVVGRLILGQGLFQFYSLAQRPAFQHAPQAYTQTLADVLSALSALHAAGILHRDIKPDNILVQAGGHAVLVDYDLSGPIREEFAIPRRIGTQAFQSPESRLSQLLEPQSDLWSVGILLYWGLYAELPDEDETDDDLPGGDLPGDEGAKQPAAPSSALIFPEHPLTHLRSLAQRLLNPDPQQRPAQAEAVRAELLRAAYADGIVAAD